MLQPSGNLCGLLWIHSRRSLFRGRGDPEAHALQGGARHCPFGPGSGAGAVAGGDAGRGDEGTNAGTLARRHRRPLPAGQRHGAGSGRSSPALGGGGALLLCATRPGTLCPPPRPQPCFARLRPPALPLRGSPGQPVPALLQGFPASLPAPPRLVPLPLVRVLAAASLGCL